MCYVKSLNLFQKYVKWLEMKYFYVVPSFVMSRTHKHTRSYGNQQKCILQYDNFPRERDLSKLNFPIDFRHETHTKISSGNPSYIENRNGILDNG